MNFDFSDEQKMLRDNARRFLGETATFARIRKVLESGAGFDRELWRQAAELGWTGAAIAERHGGLGLGPLELCVLSEELGRTLAPIPFFSSVCLSAELLKHCSEDRAGETLSRIAAGTGIVALATEQGGQGWGWEGLSTRYADGRVSGSLSPVPDLLAADRIIVSAKGAEGVPMLLLLDTAGPGVTRKALQGIDPLRPHGALDLQQARATPLAAGDEARRLLEQALDQAAIYAAFEQIGAAEGALHMARDYALQRHAFGRPIAGYQAVKHRLADMLVRIELARSNAYFGVWAVDSGSDELRLAAAAARLSATEALEFAAEENLHLHGGIGYTWEADCHFYYRRARLLAVSLGNAAFWGERLLCAPAAENAVH